MPSFRHSLAALLIGLTAFEPLLLAAPRIVRAEDGAAAAVTASPDGPQLVDSDTMPPQPADDGPGLVDSDTMPPQPAGDGEEDQSPLPPPIASNQPTQPNEDTEGNGTPRLHDIIGDGGGHCTILGDDDLTHEYPLSDERCQGAVPEDDDMPEASTTPPVVATSTPATSTLPVIDFPNVDASTTSTTTNPTDTSVLGPLGTTTTATATSSGPVIQSGESVALANILNILNTNLVNSSGNAVLLNYVDPVSGTVDLRGGLAAFGTSSAVCALFACAGTGGVSVNLGSDAGIHNAVVLNATSGGNAIEHAGDAVITTGNAYAGLNLINVANTNIIDSNYLLVSMNAFQGVNGDIVFPSLTNFLSSLANNLTPGSITASGNATVTNDVDASAQSGGNQTSNTASSTIRTGGSTGTGSVFNQINANMLGGAAVSILFRVQGSWAGEVFGAPEGLKWVEGPGGLIALFDDEGGTGGSQTLANVSASSTADIDNDVSVIALTGDNRVDDAASALITTGNALASANVLNVANTNVVGKNWIMAIINIFGDFTGNIAFGRPDLWVGEQVSVPAHLSSGDTITYTFSVINNGDSPATDVTLTDAYDQAHITVLDSSTEHTTDASGNTVWSLGTIPAGGAVEVTYHGQVVNASPGTDITNTVRVAGHETDNNMDDNTDTATVTLPSLSSGHRTPRHVDLVPAASAVSAHLTVERSTATSTTDGSVPVHQRLVLANDSGSATIPLSVHDALIGPDGTTLHEEVWDVGSLAAGDAVELAYDASFAASAPSGTYTLSTIVYDSTGTELGRFSDNGSIVLARSAAPLGVHALGSLVAPREPHDGSLLGAVFPGIAVAHAAENGDAAAAAGLLTLPWFALLALALALLAALLFLAARSRRTGSEAR